MFFFFVIFQFSISKRKKTLFLSKPNNSIEIIMGKQKKRTILAVSLKSIIIIKRENKIKQWVFDIGCEVKIKTNLWGKQCKHVFIWMWLFNVKWEKTIISIWKKRANLKWEGKKKLLLHFSTQIKYLISIFPFFSCSSSSRSHLSSLFSFIYKKKSRNGN